MKGLDKYLKFIPYIYAIYLPINFAIHLLEINKGCIMTIFLYASDLLKILVIACFSYYVVNTYKSYLKVTKDPGALLMVMAGATFLELVYNIVVSRDYKLSYGNDHATYLALFMIAEFVLETLAIYRLTDSDGGSPLFFCWVGINALLCVLLLSALFTPGDDEFNRFLFAVVVRIIIRAAVIHKYEKNRCITVEECDEE